MEKNRNLAIIFEMEDELKSERTNSAGNEEEDFEFENDLKDSDEEDYQQDAMLDTITEELTSEVNYTTVLIS